MATEYKLHELDEKLLVKCTCDTVLRGTDFIILIVEGGEQHLSWHPFPKLPRNFNRRSLSRDRLNLHQLLHALGSSMTLDLNS
ncbi:hypothetical protein TNCV_4431481 [Trichonephila clavipes]|nr:hypothetical protein TNCV_4431481 [Trichonephila clavipes]